MDLHHTQGEAMGVVIPDWQPLGDRAWEWVGAPRGAAAWLAAQDGVRDAWEAFGTVAVELEDGGALPREVPGESGDSSGREVVLPVRWDGDDLDAVAAQVGWSRAQVIEELMQTPLTVEAIGFQPGFPYMTGLTGPLAEIPRRETPRPQVPAGSVAIANGMVGVYPRACPGGWWLVGTCLVSMVDEETEDVRLAAGDQVRWERSE
jgi:KipI family sensor histidine kinase inhibitor